MAETISMPKLGFDMAEGTLVRWVRNEGEQINKGEVLAEIETDKATVEVASSASGVIRKLLVDQGAVVPVGTPIAIVGAADEVINDQLPVISEQSSVNSVQKAASGESREGRGAAPIQQTAVLKASPLAKKIARENRVDLSQVKGSSPGGRIVRRDIEAALAAIPTPQPSVHPAIQPSDQFVTMSKLRAAIGRRMAEAKQQAPHFYVTHEYRMDALIELRKQYNAIVPEDQKLSVNDFIVKAAALTLRQFPNLNASLKGDKVLQHGQVNVGVAVSVEGGLLTVVCKDADQKPLRQIAAEVKAMAARARQGKVRPDDIEGSTFSVSNLGMYDVDEFIAIINPPESAILAVGTARETVMVHDGAMWPGKAITLTLSADHRVVDGLPAARFMARLKELLESPAGLV